MRLAALLFLGILSACAKSHEFPDLPQKTMKSAELERQCSHLCNMTARNKRLSWKHHLPIVFQIDVDFPKEFVASIESAMKTWNEAAGLELFRLDSHSRPISRPANDGINTIYFMTNDSRAESFRSAIASGLDRDSGIAETSVFAEANKIIDTDIIFEGADHSFSTDKIHVGTYDVESVALHELGHSLGLGHNSNPLSVMFFAESPISLSLRTLDNTSIQMIACEYP